MVRPIKLSQVVKQQLLALARPGRLDELGLAAQTNQEFLEVSTFEELIHLDSIVAMLAKDTVSLGQNLARLGARLFFPLCTFHRTFLFGLCEFGGQGLMLRGKKENNKPPHPFFFFPRPRAETECHPRR